MASSKASIPVEGSKSPAWMTLLPCRWPEGSAGKVAGGEWLIKSGLEIRHSHTQLFDCQVRHCKCRTAFRVGTTLFLICNQEALSTDL